MQGLISHTLNRNSDYALLILLAILVLLITLAITSHSGDKYSGKTKGVVTDIFFVMPKGLTMHLSNGIDFRKNLKIGLSCPVHKKGRFCGWERKKDNLKVFLLKLLSAHILIWFILHQSLVPEGNQRFTPKHVITCFIVIVHL